MAFSQGVEHTPFAACLHLLDEVRTYGAMLHSKRIKPPKDKSFHGYAHHFTNWLRERHLDAENSKELLKSTKGDRR